MKNTERRNFLKQACVATIGMIVMAGRSAKAADAGMVDEKAPNAKAVNYFADATKVKDKKLTVDRQGVPFKNQKCSGCALYQGKAGEASGGCPIFGTQKVAANGWCASWSKKA